MCYGCIGLNIHPSSIYLWLQERRRTVHPVPSVSLWALCEQGSTPNLSALKETKMTLIERNKQVNNAFLVSFSNELYGPLLWWFYILNVKTSSFPSFPLHRRKSHRMTWGWVNDLKLLILFKVQITLSPKTFLVFSRHWNALVQGLTETGYLCFYRGNAEWKALERKRLRHPLDCLHIGTCQPVWRRLLY